MSYTRPTRWEPGTFLRPCDLCGIRFRANELTRSSDGKFRCLRWCAGEMTQLDRDRISSASRAGLRDAPPAPFGVPYVLKDTYAEEGILFNFLANAPIVDSGWTGGRRSGAAPGLTFRPLGRNQATQGSWSATCAGETMRYLYGLIVENKRPLSWISRAKVKLRELADWVFSIQIGFGVNPTFTKSNSARYGAASTTGISTYLIAEQGRLALGVLYAYKVLGDAKYLAQARAFADFLTNQQQGGLPTINFSSSDAAGLTPINYGTWSRACNSAGTQMEHVYQPDSLVCLEFLFALYGTVGDEMHGADVTLGVYTIAPQQLLSVSMSAARAFWSVGAFDAVTGTTVNGLTSSTPREFFNSYPAVKAGGWATGTGSWEYQDGPSATGTLVTAVNYAVALRALYAYEGYSAQVASLWSWLMAFVSNPAFAPTSTSRGQDAPTTLSLLGTYNPKLALSTLLQVRTSSFAAAAMNGSSVYDWQCAGLLAPIQGARDPGSLDNAKDYVTKGVVFPADYGQGRTHGPDYFMCHGLSGLSGQIAAAVPNAVDWRADKAAMVGQMFRCGNVATTLQV